ncbi:SusC/RagA family TonB-linked outer membrane protein [Polaribacter cellanae]|uniref:TonB-dependent receptor n=1 Tax=Polaribacter cellanae TaxID=2818493 RepID=A0A975CQW0_9FLAO|nr:TonB-dependent receptor [Polaribacter cellanae]QTE23680.1 TonB-dependent receptor [Polaribacter cellanae]
MKTFIFLCCTTIFAFTTENGFSQDADINISKSKTMSVKQVFKLINKQADYKFIYRHDLIKVIPKLPLNKGVIKVSALLNKFLIPYGFSYNLTENNTVIVHKKNTELNRPIVVQKKTIKGVVLDINNQPLLGASIFEKGTTNGTQTDFDGKFSLNVSNASAILVVSYVGFITQEVAVNTQQTKFTIVLQEDTASLDEIVIVGYGKQKKVNLTGAVGTVKGKTLENKPVVNVQELLQGKVPGLNVSNSSGQPGSGASINIRGTSTIGGSSGVLVIIDGIPGNIYSVNPNDIQNISVLKDAASAAIYGARAANGVILITTKSAKNHEGLRVSLTTSMGVQTPQQYIDYVGGKDYMTLYNLASVNDGLTERYTPADFKDLEDGKLPDNKWYREIFKKNQFINNNYLSLSGGNDKITTRLGIGYDKQSGALPRDKYKRLVVHPKLNYKINNWLSLDANVQYTKTNIERPQGAGSALTNAIRVSPITPIRTAQGRFQGPGGIPGGNPIAIIEEGGTNSQIFKEMTTILSATLTPLEGWNIKPLYSHSNSQTQTHNFSKPITLYNADETVFSKDPLSNQSIYDAFGTSVTEILQISTDYTFNLNENHSFSVFALASQEVSKGNNFSASRLDPAFENIYVLNIAVGTKDNSGFAYNESIASFVGRVNYNYKEKYLFEASLRHDGTSRFKPGYQWGTFPSFSAGWNIHKESFFENNINFISKFKVRGSWGKLGDALKVNRYETRNILGFNSGVYAFNGTLVGGAAATASFLDNLSWESSTKSNLGIEIGFFDNKLSLELDLFKDLRTDILYREPVPDEYGLSAPFTNTLKMENKGFELTLNYREKLGEELHFNANFNISHSKNKVLDLRGSGPWKSSRNITEVGASLNLPYGLQSNGLFRDQADIDNSATQVNVKPGNIKYVDQNEDGVINADDRVVLNDKNAFAYGFNLGIEYKSFSLNANFYGRHRALRYMDGVEGWAFFLADNARPMHKDSWTPTNLDASFPRLSLNSGGNDASFSDYWLRKADYLKLQNLTFGYTLPKALTDVVGVKNGSVSLIGQNLAIFSKYEGFDPEGGIYPLPRTITMSLQLNF